MFRGFSQILAMRKAAVAATHRFDYVLSPTAPMTAFPAEWASPSRDPLNPFPHIGFTVAFNMSEQPAASVNCGFDAEGLPIGLQIVGRRFDDVGVLSVARAYEEIRSAEMRPWPEPPAGLGRRADARLASLVRSLAGGPSFSGRGLNFFNRCGAICDRLAAAWPDCELRRADVGARWRTSSANSWRPGCHFNALGAETCHFRGLCRRVTHSCTVLSSPLVGRDLCFEHRQHFKGGFGRL